MAPGADRQMAMTSTTRARLARWTSTRMAMSSAPIEIWKVEGGKIISTGRFESPSDCVTASQRAGGGSFEPPLALCSAPPPASGQPRLRIGETIG